MASNPYKNKVVYNGDTLIDLTGDTVTPNTLISGYTAHDASGAPIVGAATGGAVTEDDVTFYDYDGTIVASYSAADFAELTAMPANPSHAGLVAQGWNWSLAEAKTYVAKHGMLHVGQTYVTDDGKTRLYITIPDEAQGAQLQFSVAYSQSVSHGVVVDWGDGSEPETSAGTSVLIRTHTYARPGNYVVTFEVLSGTVTFGSSSMISIYGELSNLYNRTRIKKIEFGDGIRPIGQYCLYSCYALQTITIPNGMTNIATYYFAYCYALQAVVLPHGVTNIGNSAFINCTALKVVVLPDGLSKIGSSVFSECTALQAVVLPDEVTSLGNSAFTKCYALKAVVLPDGLTSIGSSVLSGCRALQAVVLPDGVTSIGSSAFASCYALQAVVLPDGVTSIGSSAFASCYALRAVVLPDGVTSIGSTAFNSCMGIAGFHLLSTTPPTLSNSNAFNGLPADFVIYVPYSSDHSILEAYQTAANWSTYAGNMVEEAA